MSDITCGSRQEVVVSGSDRFAPDEAQSDVTISLDALTLLCHICEGAKGKSLRGWCADSVSMKNSEISTERDVVGDEPVHPEKVIVGDGPVRLTDKLKQKYIQFDDDGSVISEPEPPPNDMIHYWDDYDQRHYWDEPDDLDGIKFRVSEFRSSNKEHTKPKKKKSRNDPESEDSEEDSEEGSVEDSEEGSVEDSDEDSRIEVSNDSDGRLDMNKLYTGAYTTVQTEEPTEWTQIPRWLKSVWNLYAGELESIPDASALKPNTKMTNPIQFYGEKTRTVILSYTLDKKKKYKFREMEGHKFNPRMFKNFKRSPPIISFKKCSALIKVSGKVKPVLIIADRFYHRKENKKTNSFGFKLECDTTDEKTARGVIRQWIQEQVDASDLDEAIKRGIKQILKPKKKKS